MSVVVDGVGGQFVLRRPPTGYLLPTAHDMGRECRRIAALGPAGVIRRLRIGSWRAFWRGVRPVAGWDYG